MEAEGEGDSLPQLCEKRLDSMAPRILFSEQSCKKEPSFDTILQEIALKQYPRQELIPLLLDYNASIGNDMPAQNNIEKLKDSVCVFSGQQLGLLGGPLYTILKAISCLLLAKELNAAPIFWLATEDHDVTEINHTTFLDDHGNLQKIDLNFPKGVFVEDLSLQEDHRKRISPYYDLGNETSYARAMARFMATLFKGTGLVFVEPYLFRPLAKSFFSKMIVEKPTDLFFKDDRKRRVKIAQLGDSTREMLELIERSPERFSTNVFARPLLQSKLFPTVAYVAGPSEMLYYQSLGEAHHHHQIPMPVLVPRLSATLITKEAGDYLACLKLKPWENIPLTWEEAFPEIATSMHNAYQHWLQVALHTGKIDGVSPKTVHRTAFHISKAIRKDTWKHTTSKLGVPTHALHLLRNLLHPHQKLQERTLNWLYFQQRTDDNLIQELLKKLDWREQSHHYCFMEE